MFWWKNISYLFLYNHVVKCNVFLSPPKDNKIYSTVCLIIFIIYYLDFAAELQPRELSSHTEHDKLIYVTFVGPLRSWRWTHIRQPFWLSSIESWPCKQSRPNIILWYHKIWVHATLINYNIWTNILFYVCFLTSSSHTSCVCKRSSKYQKSFLVLVYKI